MISSSWGRHEPRLSGMDYGLKHLRRIEPSGQQMQWPRVILELVIVSDVFRVC
jgi:hypothetical protein